jgi:hypothetical protein
MLQPPEPVSPRAQSVPAPALSSATESTGSEPYHIATWALDGGGNMSVTEGLNASAADVNRLVTYAMGGQKAVSDCNTSPKACKSVFYFDYAMAYAPTSGCFEYPNAYEVKAASENWFLHDTGYTNYAHRVHGKDGSGNCTIWAMNPESSGLQTWLRDYLRNNAAGYDVLFADSNSMDVPDAGWFPSGGGCDPWPHICLSMEGVPNDAAEVAARIDLINAMTWRNGSPMYAFYQQVDLNNPALDVAALEGTNRYLGVTCEGCVASPDGVHPENYGRVLNAMAAVEGTHAAFVLISNGYYTNGSPAQIKQRLVTTAIVWLAYKEGHTIVQPNLEYSTDRLAIWPEDLIYPSNPLQTMIDGASDLQVAAGVWRREFGECYQKELPFGHCAAIVNSNSGAVTIRSSWLRQTYKYVITLSGGDVLSGGSARITDEIFKPGTTLIQGGSAVLLSE